jgi:GYD domain
LPPTLLNSDGEVSIHHNWLPISLAPPDCDLEVSVIDDYGVRALRFPCRKRGTKWVDASSKIPLEICPTQNPTTNRYEAAKQLTEAAGGKLISMYSTAADGPDVMVIVDLPDPSAAPAMTGVVEAAPSTM